MDALWMDLKYATRSLRQRPFFAGIVILTFALGIGSNTAIFSIINGFLLRPLSYDKADRLMSVYSTKKGQESDSGLKGLYELMGTSYPDYLDWQKYNSSFEQLSVFIPQSVNLTGTGRPDRLRGGFVSANFFKLLKINPYRGRTFLQDEEKPGSHVVILQYEVWKSQFGSDPKIIGRILNLNGEPFSVIGVLPEAFQFPVDEIGIWLPVSAYPSFESATRMDRNLFCLGRLREGVTLDQSRSDMKNIAQRLTDQYPDQNAGIGVGINPFHETIVQFARPALMILQGAVTFILLIACANIANLLLSSGIARQKELGIKAAIGASRTRLVRQMLFESILLAAAGGLAGLLLAFWGVDLLVAMSPDSIPTGFQVGIDTPVILFAFLLSFLAGILFGIAPALQLSDIRLLDFIGRAGQAISIRQGKTTKILVVSQIALSLILLVGSGLLIKSFWQLIHVQPGIQPENLYSMEYRLPRNKYPEPDQQLRFHTAVLEQIKGIHGVESVGIARGLPFSGNGSNAMITLPDRKLPEKGSEPTALLNTVSDQYFKTIGIPLLKGRNFQAQDHLNAPIVVIINQKLAEKYWPNQEAIGKQIHVVDEDVTATVIGVVGNSKQYSLDEEFEPQLFISLTQNPGFFATVVARTSFDPMQLTEQIKNAVWRVDPDQPMWKIRTVQFLIERNVSNKRFLLTLLVSFASLALLLTLIGLYGVVSHFVRRRTRDIGVRMALGAQRQDILSMVVKQGLTLSTIGALVGLAGSVAMTRILTGLLYQVKPTDPTALIAGVLFLSIAALLACLIPAIRATRIHPNTALRYE